MTRYARPEGVDADAILRVLRVPPECEGMRLDRFLPSQLRATSRTRAQSIIEVSAFSAEGRRLRSSDRVRGEQQICLWRPAFDEAAPDRPPSVLYEDDYLLAVDKPPHMTVHPTARHHRHTVIKTLEATRRDPFLSLIHRLDRETSGVLLLAKTPDADRLFKRQLEERSLEAARAADRGAPPGPADKIYWAITWGRPSEGLIDARLTEDPSPLRVKVRVADPGFGAAARTNVRVLSTTQRYALVECALHTGRQHQIRVHLAHGGAPIVGDKLYGPDERLLARGADRALTEEDLEILELPRHALHAAWHRIDHPFLGKSIEIHAPLADDLARFWTAQGGHLFPNQR